MAFSVEIDLLVAAAELKEEEQMFLLKIGSYITPRTKNWPIIEREMTNIWLKNKTNWLYRSLIRGLSKQFVDKQYVSWKLPISLRYIISSHER